MLLSAEKALREWSEKQEKKVMTTDLILCKSRRMKNAEDAKDDSKRWKCTENEELERSFRGREWSELS